MNTHNGKVKIHPWIDLKLNHIMEIHCNCKRIYKQDFIAQAIAEVLDIPLGDDFMIDESLYDYNDFKIKEINKEIERLKAMKLELEAMK